MRSQRLAIWIVCLAGLGLASCKKSAAAPSGGGSNANSVSITIPAGDGYGNASSFAPGTTSVPVGGLVTWNNRDTFAHTTTSDTGQWTADLPAGGTYSRQFPTRGTFSYKCTIHAGMTGTIAVQ